VTVELTLDPTELEYETADDYKNRWDELVASFNEQAPEPLQNAFHATPEDGADAWALISAQRVCRLRSVSLVSLMVLQRIIRSVFQGFGLSFLLAFFVLAIGINNWILPLVAITFVSFVIIMLFGILGIAGIDLGILETIDFSVVIALSMNYFIPLVVAYGTACAVDRNVKTRKAFEAAGAAIFMGSSMNVVVSLL
jgi:predicted RND superfamily exporter protein